MRKEKLKLLRELYPAGTRLECISMEDVHAVPSGTCGTVIHVDDAGTIHMKWDNGSSLGLIAGEDQFRKCPENKMIQTM